MRLRNLKISSKDIIFIAFASVVASVAAVNFVMAGGVFMGPPDLPFTQSSNVGYPLDTGPATQYKAGPLIFGTNTTNIGASIALDTSGTLGFIAPVSNTSLTYPFQFLNSGTARISNIVNGIQIGTFEAYDTARDQYGGTNLVLENTAGQLSLNGPIIAFSSQGGQEIPPPGTLCGEAWVQSTVGGAGMTVNSHWSCNGQNLAGTSNGTGGTSVVCPAGYVPKLLFGNLQNVGNTVGWTKAIYSCIKNF